ncbi:GNAT family N-acetyltransferase [Roseibium sp. CAU 1637]|uniref:GNAT family N-acetyltransferase n=1 Tax=Roseibium limicola TaxID=2816037 RepID=A0A939EQ27_9HYPH|nr:GNAT family N-acetyltransferase [Roseibium limicola]MBO0346245.1 GNAT family N-acetyltransferase [Roseibium limicola]
MATAFDQLTLSLAGPEDGPALQQLYRHLIANDLEIDGAAAEAAYLRMIGHPGLSVFLGSLHGTPVTTCTLVIIPNLSRAAAPYALIENVVTDAAHRSRGYGAQLVQAAIALAWKTGCYKIMLLSGNGNAAGHRFYERLGFRTTKVGFELRAEGVPSRHPG